VCSASIITTTLFEVFKALRGKERYTIMHAISMQLLV
jgi:hypothetical protein